MGEARQYDGILFLTAPQLRAIKYWLDGEPEKANKVAKRNLADIVETEWQLVSRKGLTDGKAN